MYRKNVAVIERLKETRLLELELALLGNEWVFAERPRKRELHYKMREVEVLLAESRQSERI